MHCAVVSAPAPVLTSGSISPPGLALSARFSRIPLPIALGVPPTPALPLKFTRIPLTQPSASNQNASTSSPRLTPLPLPPKPTGFPPSPKQQSQTPAPLGRIPLPLQRSATPTLKAIVPPQTQLTTTPISKSISPPLFLKPTVLPLLKPTTPPALHPTAPPLLPIQMPLNPRMRKTSRAGPSLERMRALERDNVALRIGAERAQRRLAAFRRRVCARAACTMSADRPNRAAKEEDASKSECAGRASGVEGARQQVGRGVQTQTEPEPEPEWALIASEAYHRARVADLEEELALQRSLTETAALHADTLSESYEDMSAFRDVLIGDLRAQLVECRFECASAYEAGWGGREVWREDDGEEEEEEEEEEGDEEEEEEPSVLELRALEAELAEQHALLTGASRNAVAATNHIVALEAAARRTHAERCALRAEVDGLRSRVAELESAVRDAEARLATEETFLLQLKKQLDNVHEDGEDAEDCATLVEPKPTPASPGLDKWVRDVPRLVDEQIPPPSTELDITDEICSPPDTPCTAYFSVPSTPHPGSFSFDSPNSPAPFFFPPASLARASLAPSYPPTRSITPPCSLASCAGSPTLHSHTDAARERALEIQLDALLLRLAAAEAARACGDDVEELLGAELRAAQADNARLRRASAGVGYDPARDYENLHQYDNAESGESAIDGISKGTCEDAWTGGAWADERARMQSSIVCTPPRPEQRLGRPLRLSIDTHQQSHKALSAARFPAPPHLACACQ
jgi:hypothetical protein